MNSNIVFSLHASSVSISNPIFCNFLMSFLLVYLMYLTYLCGYTKMNMVFNIIYFTSSRNLEKENGYRYDSTTSL